MFPVSALPYSPFALQFSAAPYHLCFWHLSRKRRLDQRPTQWKISITRWQTPNCVQMIWQYHHRDNVERMGLPDLSHCIAEYINLFSKELAFTICEIDSEKVGGSSYVRSAVSHRI
jgi:hypothetical protein